MKIAIIILALLATTYSFDASAKPKKKKTPKPSTTETAAETTPAPPVRTVSEEKRTESESVETETTTTATVHPARAQKNWFVRLTGAGGFSTAASNDTRESDARAATGYNRNPYGALSVVGQWGQSLGAEAEGYLSGGNSRIASSVDKVTGLVAARSRSLTQNGVMVDAQLRYPVTSFRRDWGLHLGVGYGATGVKEVAPPSLASTVDSSYVSVSGAYGTAGFEVRVVPDIAFNADYAISFLTSSNRTLTSGGADSTTAFNSGQFDRLRIGAAYLVTTDWRVGLLYTRRLIKGTMADGSVNQEITNQFLGTLQVIL